jgi:Family of unknown function (DUF6221)
MDPVKFAQAQLDEDEATARAAYCEGPSPGQPTAPPKGSWWTTAQIMERFGPGTFLDARHIVRHDPARALREVEAGRRILARHRRCGDGYGFCDDGGHGGGAAGCAEMKDLLYRWADHPDYDQEWKPADL